MEPKPKMVIASRATDNDSSDFFSTILNQPLGIQLGPQIPSHPSMAPTLSLSSMPGSDMFANQLPPSFLNSPFQDFYLSNPFNLIPRHPFFDTHQAIVPCTSNQVRDPTGNELEITMNWTDTGIVWSGSDKRSSKREEDTVQSHIPTHSFQAMQYGKSSHHPYS